VWWALSAAAVGVSLFSVPGGEEEEVVVAGGNMRVTPWRAAVILTGFLEATVIFRGVVVARGLGVGVGGVEVERGRGSIVGGGDPGVLSWGAMLLNCGFVVVGIQRGAVSTM
jgi:hypothetical protein